MFFSTSKQVLPIGLDLGTGSTKLVQLRRNGESYTMQAMASINIPRHLRTDQIGRLDFLRQNLPRLINQHPFIGKRCHLCLPTDSCFIRHVKVPRLDGKALDNVVREAAQSELPYPIENAVVRHLVAGEVYSEGETRLEVIVVAIPLSTLDAYMQMVQQTGLDVECINVEAVALIDGLSDLFDWASEPEREMLILDIGASSTQVVIARGSRLVFARNLPRGAAHADEVIAQRLELRPDQVYQARRQLARGQQVSIDEQTMCDAIQDWIDDLASEIQQCLLYHRSQFRTSGVERVIFTGGQARDKRFCQMLAATLNLPAQVGDPMVAMQAGLPGKNRISSDHDPMQQSQPDLVVSIGLSLGEHQTQEVSS